MTNGGNETVLTIGGDGGANTLIGTIRNGNGLIDLAKTGSSTQTLAGALVNTYTGPTSISGGSFILDLVVKIGDVGARARDCKLLLDLSLGVGE